MKPSQQGKRTHNPTSGLFITFEGSEGSGKTTQCHRLAGILRSQGYHVLETREPGGTPVAEAIRRLLLDHSKAAKREKMTPACETALILAARAQHVAHVIEPALAQGMIVLCDRFFDSTLAYQGYGRKLDSAFLHVSHQFATGGLTPHLTFYLDLPVQEGLARRRKSREQNRLDRESLDFHQRVRRGFLALAKQHAHRIKKLDARQSPDTLNIHIVSHTMNVIYTDQFNFQVHPQKKSLTRTKEAPVHGVSRYCRTSTTS